MPLRCGLIPMSFTFISTFSGAPADVRFTPESGRAWSRFRLGIARAVQLGVSLWAKADMSDLSHGDQAPSLASRGDLHAKGNNCKHRPTAMKKNSRSYHQAAGNRPNGGAPQDIGEAS